jgi:hypothetical protein
LAKWTLRSLPKTSALLNDLGDYRSTVYNCNAEIGGSTSAFTTSLETDFDTLDRLGYVVVDTEEVSCCRGSRDGAKSNNCDLDDADSVLSGRATRAEIDAISYRNDAGSYHAIGQVNTHRAQEGRIRLYEYVEAVDADRCLNVHSYGELGSNRAGEGGGT